MTAFLVIGVVGLVLLVAALVAGEVLDGVLEPIGDVLGGDLLSTGAVAGFLAAFGFTAFVFTPSLGAGLSGVVGLLAGGLVGWGTGLLTRSLATSRTDVTPSAATFVGLRGTVVSALPSQGYGEVNVVVAGHPTKLNARSYEPLPPGTPVTVVSVISPTAVRVARVE
jgi:membrane protein implicated in regulation of membrane protease activity